MRSTPDDLPGIADDAEYVGPVVDLRPHHAITGQLGGHVHVPQHILADPPQVPEGARQGKEATRQHRQPF
jgi:hypothetical protein